MACPNKRIHTNIFANIPVLQYYVWCPTRHWHGVKSALRLMNMTPTLASSCTCTQFRCVHTTFNWQHRRLSKFEHVSSRSALQIGLITLSVRADLIDKRPTSDTWRQENGSLSSWSLATITENLTCSPSSTSEIQQEACFTIEMPLHKGLLSLTDWSPRDQLFITFRACTAVIHHTGQWGSTKWSQTPINSTWWILSNQYWPTA